MTDLTVTRTDVPTDDRPWLDARLPVDERVELLLAEMTLEEKAGLFFHTMIAMGDLTEADPDFGAPSAVDFVEARHMTHFNLLGAAPSAGEIAEWHNALQRLAASTRLGIPVTLSTDPRHSFSDNPGAAILGGSVLAVARDARASRRSATSSSSSASPTSPGRSTSRSGCASRCTRRSTSPPSPAGRVRWPRSARTPSFPGRLGAAYIRGFQGASFGARSVSTMTKHFPGGGPQKDGEDPHFAYGREQVYPGGVFELHLKPFEAAFEAGTRQVMPYYGMPVGTEYEEVGFGFNKSVITGLLRERYGFDGVVCTDWGLINDAGIFGQPFPARAWGVEAPHPATSA